MKNFEALPQRTENFGGEHSITYRITDSGTAYHLETSERIVDILEAARNMGTRLVIHYGDAKTGKAWGDTATGRIGRSTGSIKIPLVIANRRSTGGGGLLDHCIVKIETAAGKLLVYIHPDYHKDKA